MCLYKIERQYKEPLHVVRVGWKVILRKNGSMPTAAMQTSFIVRPNKWRVATGGKIWVEQGRGTYKAGFHVLLNKSDAVAFMGSNFLDTPGSEYHEVVPVLYTDVTARGTDGNWGHPKTVIAKWIKYLPFSTTESEAVALAKNAEHPKTVIAKAQRKAVQTRNAKRKVQAASKKVKLNAKTKISTKKRK